MFAKKLEVKSLKFEGMIEVTFFALLKVTKNLFFEKFSGPHFHLSFGHSNPLILKTTSVKGPLQAVEITDWHLKGVLLFWPSEVGHRPKNDHT